MVGNLQQGRRKQARSSQHSLLWERGPLQERQLNVKLKELQYQQLKLQQEVEASKQVIQLSHEALLGRFDALEHQLLQAPKRGVRLPHTLTVSLATEPESPTVLYSITTICLLYSFTARKCTQAMKMLKNLIYSKGEWHIGNSELDCYVEPQHMSDTSNQMQHSHCIPISSHKIVACAVKSYHTSGRPNHIIMALLHFVSTQHVFSIVSSHNTKVRSRMYQDIVKAVGEQFDEATIRVSGKHYHGYLYISSKGHLSLL